MTEQPSEPVNQSTLILRGQQELYERKWANTSACFNFRMHTVQLLDQTVRSIKQVIIVFILSIELKGNNRAFHTFLNFKP